VHTVLLEIWPQMTIMCGNATTNYRNVRDAFTETYNTILFGNQRDTYPVIRKFWSPRSCQLHQTIRQKISNLEN
jgi:hypothetical protein